MSISKEQSYKIQVLRGLAIIAVVFIHNLPVGILQVYLRPFLNFAVGLFLFFSGYLTEPANWSPWKRLKKVLIPYIIWTLIYVILRNIKTPGAIPLAFIKGILTANSAAIMYYVYIYCEFTILVPLIDRLAKSKYCYLGFLISPAEIVIMRMLPLILGIKLHEYALLVIKLSCLGWFSYFYLGYLIGRKKVKVNVRTKRLLVLLLVSIALQMAEGYWYWRMGETNCGTQTKLTAILTGIIFCLICDNYLSTEKNYHFGVLKALGDNSFGIYFAHLAVMAGLSVIPSYSLIVFPVKVPIVIAVTYACIVFGKKILGKSAGLFGM